MCYKAELHLHTSEVSPCGSVPAAKAMEQYRQSGYDLVVVTDHYYDGFFANRQGDWPQIVDQYLAGYMAAKEAGEALGLTVLLGLELRFHGHMDDYLVYGVDRDFLLQYPRLYQMTQEEFFVLANREGLFLAQAHPFRPGCDHQKGEYLHGVEVFNGNVRHNSHNEKALAFAQQYGLVKIAGSDFHEDYDVGTAAVLLPQLPKTSRELAQMLLENRIDGLLRHGEAL